MSSPSSPPLNTAVPYCRDIRRVSRMPFIRLPWWRETQVSRTILRLIVVVSPVPWNCTNLNSDRFALTFSADIFFFGYIAYKCEHDLQFPSICSQLYLFLYIGKENNWIHILPFILCIYWQTKWVYTQFVFYFSVYSGHKNDCTHNHYFTFVYILATKMIETSYTLLLTIIFVAKIYISQFDLLIEFNLLNLSNLF